VDTMLFMDWRDDHLADLPEVKERNSKLPTFLYAMPFTKNKVMQATQLNCTASSISRSNSELGHPREQQAVRHCRSTAWRGCWLWQDGQRAAGGWASAKFFMLHRQHITAQGSSSAGLSTLLCCRCRRMLRLKVFLEETSLVARPAVEFPDLKERLEARMKWLGIKVLLPSGGGGLHL